MEISFAVVRNEKSSNRSIRIVSAEISIAFIELGDYAIGSHSLKNITANRSVPQRLGKRQVLLLRDAAKLAAVFTVVLFKLSPAAEARAGSPGQQRGKEKPKQQPISFASQ